MSALWMMARTRNAPGFDAKMLHHISGNGSIVLLVGSFVIGMITGEDGMQELHPFIVVPFTGVLAVFLLDMGLSAGKSLFVNRHELSWGLFGFGYLMPIVGSLAGSVMPLYFYIANL